MPNYNLDYLKNNTNAQNVFISFVMIGCEDWVKVNTKVIKLHE